MTAIERIAPYASIDSEALAAMLAEKSPLAFLTFAGTVLEDAIRAGAPDAWVAFLDTPDGWQWAAEASRCLLAHEARFWNCRNAECRWAWTAWVSRRPEFFAVFGITRSTVEKANA